MLSRWTVHAGAVIPLQNVNLPGIVGLGHCRSVGPLPWPGARKPLWSHSVEPPALDRHHTQAKAARVVGQLGILERLPRC